MRNLEMMSVPDLESVKQQALAAFDEMIERAQALHDALEGVSASARADLAYLKAMLALAKTKI